MPTTSQNQMIKKVSRQSRNAVQAYIPPHHKVFSFTGYQHGTDIRQRTLPVPDVNKQATFFSEMLSLAALPTHPGGTSDTMSADDIMSRLQNLGWRKEGAAVRRAELEKREEEKRQAAEEMKQKPLDLVNDPLLRRVAKKNQELPKYTKPPDSRPCAICFDVNGPSVAHSTVVEHLGTLLSEFEEDIKVEALEFQPRSVLLNSVNADNRWVITLSSQYSVTCVSGTKLTLGPHKEVTLRSYDDVMSLEYKQFTSKSNFMKMLHKAE